LDAFFDGLIPTELRAQPKITQSKTSLKTRYVLQSEVMANAMRWAIASLLRMKLR